MESDGIYADWIFIGIFGIQFFDDPDWLDDPEDVKDCKMFITEEIYRQAQQIAAETSSKIMNEIKNMVKETETF